MFLFKNSLEIYNDPLTTECSHTFCSACITDYIKIPGMKSKCPLCQKTIAKRELRKDRNVSTFV